MKNIIKKISAILVTVAILLSANSFLIETARAATQEELKNLDFQVTKYLKLPNDSNGNLQQSQSYFQTPADNQNNPSGTTPSSDSQSTPFPVVTFILDVINLLVKIAGTIAVMMLIVTGLVMMVSQGSQNATEKAKSMFGYTILGIIIIFVSYVLVTLVQSIFTI